MTEIFPSIIPRDERKSPLTVHDEWDYNVLRKVIAEHDTDAVNGKSPQLEMADWITGQYSQDELQKLRDAGQADDESDVSENTNIKAAITEIRE
uniref:Uncharacterized protein n=1 Tax=uncultured virus TaxID=340016 RepID=D5L2Q8_9VIRU|nr:hypothetical protein [uncultured virus]